MANMITLSILLAICLFSPVYPAAPALQVVIYHSVSGSLVHATLAQVAANGVHGGQHS